MTRLRLLNHARVPVQLPCESRERPIRPSRILRATTARRAINKGSGAIAAIRLVLNQKWLWRISSKVTLSAINQRNRHGRARIWKTCCSIGHLRQQLPWPATMDSRSSSQSCPRSSSKAQQALFRRTWTLMSARCCGYSRVWSVQRINLISSQVMPSHGHHPCRSTRCLTMTWRVAHLWSKIGTNRSRHSVSPQSTTVMMSARWD